MHEALETEGAQVVVAFLDGVAGLDGGGEILRAGCVFFDAAAVFGEDGKLDGDVLVFFFERGDGGFEGGFVDVGEFVFGVGGEGVGILLFAEIAELWVSCVCWV